MSAQPALVDSEDDTEQWAPIAGWVGLYEVSNTGQVRSLPRFRCKGRILRHGTTHNGYLTVTFSANGRREARTLHRVVAEAFLGPKPEGYHTCHIDGDKLNNAATNLKYATQSENELDKVRHGTHYLANRTHCPAGHEYTTENTRVRNQGRGRSCKACHREQQAKRRERSKRMAAILAKRFPDATP